jgi:hypothetical protein
MLALWGSHGTSIDKCQQIPPPASELLHRAQCDHTQSPHGQAVVDIIPKVHQLLAASRYPATLRKELAEI